MFRTAKKTTSFFLFMCVYLNVNATTFPYFILLFMERVGHKITILKNVTACSFSCDFVSILKLDTKGPFLLTAYNKINFFVKRNNKHSGNKQHSLVKPNILSLIHPQFESL